MRYISLLLLAVAITFSSCRKRPDPVLAPASGDLTLEFSNTVGPLPLELNGRSYLNAHGDSFTVSTFKYYVSNISLTTATGQTYTEPESYHLINHELLESRTVKLTGLPLGNYTQLRFMIGVDSARNVSGAQTGHLSPNFDMYWTWESGYVMAKMEGHSPQSTMPSKQLMFHMGGFGGQYATQRWVTLTFPGYAAVGGAKTPNVHLRADLGEWFKSPSEIDFSKLSLAMQGPDAAMIADNYADMFKIDHID